MNQNENTKNDIMKKLKTGREAPIEEWLKQLPDGYRQRALSQIDRERNEFRAVVDSRVDAIWRFAPWSKTEEKASFWLSVYLWAEFPDSNYLPRLPDDGQDYQEKPPMGLMPRRLWIEKRMRDVAGSIGRYIGTDNPVPTEWVEEYNDLLSQMEAERQKRRETE